MRTFLALAALAAIAATASAECANACSGHGVCSSSDQCDCFPNYRAADCSERVCPYGFAWVDTPRGDLNHDGTLVSTAVPISSSGSNIQYEYESFPADSTTGKVAQKNEGHFYTECSNKGLCDRTLGECACFDGYTGSSCQRTTCPNECSGHGVCRTVEEITAGALTKRKVDSAGADNFWEGVSTKTQYRLWDMDMAQSCVCDAGFTGPDCSRRQCPRGDDPLTHRSAECGGFPCRVEKQRIVFGGTGRDDYINLQFTDWTGKVWNTEKFWFGGAAGLCYTLTDKDAIGALLESKLEALPNGILQDVKVTATDAVTFDIEFTTKPGNLEQIAVYRTNSQTALADPTKDCTANVAVTATITDTTFGTEEESACSNRGVCDYDTGLCKCFKGYTSDDCSLQNALAQ